MAVALVAVPFMGLFVAIAAFFAGTGSRTPRSSCRRATSPSQWRLFAEWGIGKKHRDNGALLLVAVRDRHVHIEVGYGLEPILPDGRAGEIIRTSIVPLFRAGNIPRGIGTEAKSLTYPS
jgi:uncharacterized protein